METLMLTKENGQKIPVELHIDTYVGGNFYLGLYDMSNGYAENFCNVTKNLDIRLNGCFGFVDTNNYPFLPEFLKENGIATNYMGLSVQSGFCSYPLYQFHEERLRELCPDGYACFLQARNENMEKESRQGEGEQSYER